MADARASRPFPKPDAKPEAPEKVAVERGVATDATPASAAAQAAPKSKAKETYTLPSGAKVEDF